MDQVTVTAFAIVIAAGLLYVLYWVIRRAVAAGIRDEREQREQLAQPRDESTTTRGSGSA